MDQKLIGRIEEIEILKKYMASEKKRNNIFRIKEGENL